MLPSCLTPCKYKIENAAPIFLPSPKTTMLRAAFPRDKGAARRDRRPACPLPDRGRRLAGPTCGAGVIRSFSFGKSHRAPAAWLPGSCSGPPLFICGEKKTSSHKPRHFWMIFGLVQRDFFKYFFMFSKPRSTARRTALSSTPSASATSE